MTIAQTTQWFENFKSQIPRVNTADITIVLCVPFTVLSYAKEFIATHHLPLYLGAQDVSPFGKGPYTGEISADMIAELASFVLIGHWERRQYFNEGTEELAFQALQAKSAGLSVIYCTNDSLERIPHPSDIIAFEPDAAIGTGKPLTAEDISLSVQKLRLQYHKPIIYGGSVTDDLVISCVSHNTTDGFLIGEGSLDATVFASIISKLSEYV